MMFLTLNGLVLKKMIMNVFFTTFSMVVNQQTADTCLVKHEEHNLLKTSRTEVPPRPKAKHVKQIEESLENYYFFYNNALKPIPKKGCLRTPKK